MMTSFDTNQALHITPHHRGVKLLRPENLVNAESRTIGEVLEFPCNVYLLDTESRIQNINERSAFSCGFQTKEDSIGRSVFDVLTPASARALANVDREVVTSNRAKISDDTVIVCDDDGVDFLSIKTPVYDDKNEVMGVFGCSVALGLQPLAESLNLVANIGLLGSLCTNRVMSYVSYQQIAGVIYTRRQSEIISYLVTGYTAAQIAAKLSISRRTVEHHIENIKLKMGVASKAQLVDAVLSDRD